MLERLIIAGFGGQGLMFVGKLLAHLVMEEGRHVTYFPSYGAEVRGGTANCHIIISTEEIHSPVAEVADSLIIMNQPSYGKFIARLDPQGIAFLNSSLVTPGEPSPGRQLLIPATDIAQELSDPRVANVVMLGAYNGVRRLLADDRIHGYLRKIMVGAKQEFLDMNLEAYERGRELALREFSVS